jgi:hypothetical protein
MARPAPNATDRARMQRLDRVTLEIQQQEKRLEQLRASRNKLIYQIAEARILPAMALATKAGVSEPYVYRCLHDKGRPRTGAAK